MKSRRMVSAGPAVGMSVAGGVAALLGACIEGGQGRARPLAVGDPAPSPAVPLPKGEPSVVWAFRAADCLTCALGPSAWVVRQLQLPANGGLEAVVVAIGDAGGETADRETVDRFLAKERIQATVLMQSRRRYESEFGRGARLPALYFVGPDGTVKAVLPSPSEPDLTDWKSIGNNRLVTKLLEAITPSGKVVPANQPPAT